jgi:hypothetical protein
VAKGTNRLTRDNAGKITSVGGTGATARGGRLRTAAGNQRATQTAKAKGGERAGVIKGRVATNPGVMGKAWGGKPTPAVTGKIDAGKAAARASDLRARAAKLEQQGNALMSGGRRDGASVNVSLSSRARRNETNAGFRGLEMSRQAATLRSRANTIEQRAAQSAAKAAREAAKPKRVRTPESLRMSRAKQVVKRREMKIDTLPNSTLAKRSANSARTQSRAIAYLKAGAKAKPPAGGPKRSPKTGRDIQMAQIRKVQNEKLRDINRRIKEAGPSAGGLRLEKLKLQNAMQATQPRRR